MNKRSLLAILIALMPMAIFGQTYTALWKKAAEAEQQDLPRSQYDLLMQIVKKADQERNFGQLLKAELKGAQVMTRIAPDSLQPAVERMETRCQQEKDVVMKTVYQTVLWRICQDNPRLEKTVEKPALTPDICRQLAAVKAESLEPVILKGTDSKLFDHDLLSVIGMQTNDYDALHGYYDQAGNRRATLLTALELLRRERPAGRVQLQKADYLERIDSLINRYADLTEAGEAVIERYEYMAGHTDATPEQLWQYINWGLERYGSWQRMNVLRQAQRDLTSLQFNAIIDQRVALPGQEQTVGLKSLRGITQLTLRVYRVNANGDTELRAYNAEDYRKLKPLLTPLPEMTQTQQYVGKKEYELFEDSLTLKGLPVGVYMLEIESAPQTEVSRQFYFVSNVRVMYEAQPEPLLTTDEKWMQTLQKNHDETCSGQHIRYVVVDATTGQPLKGAKVKLSFPRGYKQKERTQILTTDEQGEAMLMMTSNERPYQVFAYTDDDKACAPTDGYGRFNYYSAASRVEQTVVMTDRAIYRPGQTVHVAAIVYETADGYKHSALKDQKCKLRLYDANGKEVASKDLVSDQYGTVEADFTLPQGGLTGMFHIEAQGGSAYFRVEQYKRPTFQVEFPDVNEHYEDGDTVVVKGKALTYSGVPVQGAKVKYTVVRRRAWWWMSYSRYWSMGSIGVSSADEEVGTGEALTAQDGTFSVELPMVLPKTDFPMFYNFVCTADITDQAGETHQGQLSLPLGNRKTAFSVDLPEQLLREKPEPMTFHLRNAAGIDISAEVRYRVNGGKWQTANTQQKIPVVQPKSGLYELEAICEKDTLKQRFTVFSLDDERPAAETDDWFYVSDPQFPRDGSPVTLQVGSSAKDLHIVYSIISGDRVLESGAVKKSGALLNRKFTYKEEYGNGLLLTYAWVKQGRCYRHTAHIQRPLPDERLMLEWNTFRDRLTPGQQEEWSLTVKNPDGTPADAQLTAVLFDKSLDQLQKHQWYFTPYLSLPMPGTEWRYGSWAPLGLLGMRHAGHLTIRSLHYSHFDDDAFPDYRSYRAYGIGGARLRGVSMAAASNKAFSLEESAVMDEASPGILADVAVLDVANKKRVLGKGLPASSADDAGEEPANDVQVRENLQETAFFYPRLQTDSCGQVMLKFTLPESLTTWRFMGLAHNSALCNGLLEGETVAKKDVMIQPNVPRFIREGDEVTISARIFNTGESDVKGTARLYLIDPETEETVYEARLPFSVGKASTTSVGFRFNTSSIRQQGSLYICKVTAIGAGFSDGEQHYLPLLPSRERVTITVPFTQNEPGTKTIDLGTLLPKVKSDTKITIEYTNNPAWLMIQALPAIGHPHDDCALCQVASLYANTIGRYIVDQNPQAKNVFEQWMREGGDETSLNSQLEKNQELKNLVLSETPWVADADRETEQRHRLSDFFDENLMQHRLKQATEKLQTLQLADGSWSWWPQMPGSLLMTMNISETLVRMEKMVADAAGNRRPEVKTMLDQSFKYLGNEMVEVVNELKKEERKGHKVVFPSFSALQWLYICTLDSQRGNELPTKVKEANDYLIRLLKKERKNQTIYEKAMTAIILHSSQYVKSLKEYTVYKEEMGRYYDTPRAGYSWRDYRIPTQVAAIEALQLLAPQDQQTIDEMRRWLLQEKRTQAWDTSVNSVDAVYAFLIGHNEELKPQPQTELLLDDRQLDLPQSTAGIGYVKTARTYAGEKTFAAKKTSEGTSWGCVYAQFMQPASEIQSAGSGLTVKREILGEKESSFRIGQRVTVRITIDSERDLDFVQVQDKRAACMEPVSQLSGYRNGYYCAPIDNCTNYFFHQLPKGHHVIETEYYVDRPGTYETGTCTVQCAYAPEYRANTKSFTIQVKDAE